MEEAGGKRQQLVTPPAALLRIWRLTNFTQQVYLDLPDMHAPPDRTAAPKAEPPQQTPL